MPNKPRGKTSRLYKVNGADARHATFDGRDHLVVPVIAVVEGVMNGQFCPFEEISAYPQAWEGIPLPVNHPKKGDKPVSANSPDILESYVLGRLFNVHVDEASRSLKGELWIDVLKAQAHADGPEILRRMEAGEQLEVSTAYFADYEETSGVWKGERYAGIQRNLRPDHLALLPNGIGACNWSDGCGAPRVAELIPLFANSADLANNRNEVRFTMNAGIEISFDETARLVRETLNAEDPGYYHWLADVFSDFVVYEKEPRSSGPDVPAMPADKMGMFRRDYSVKAEKVTLGEATKVRRRMSYIEIPANNSQDGRPKEAETNMDKKQIVDALINNDKTPWKEADREYLMNRSECDLKMLQPAEAAAPPATSGAPAANAGAEPKPQTLEQYIAGIPDPRLQTMMRQGIATHDARKAELVAKLSANTSCAFSKSELEGMELEYLEKLASTVGVSYAGAGVPRQNDRSRQDLEENQDEVPEPPKILTAALSKK